jgi:lipopolysaccharide heptosyltransferase II
VSPPRILLVRFSSLGDVLLTTPLIRALRTRHPAATLTALTKQVWAPLLSANPHLDQVVTLAPGQSLVPVARALRRADFTDRLDLHASVRTRVLRLLVPGAWHGHGTRRRERRALITLKQNQYRDRLPVPERYFEAARHLDVRPDGAPAELFTSPAAEARAEEWLTRSGLDLTLPLIGLAPGAAHATKRWPLRHWRILAEELAERGYGMVIVGGSADRAGGLEVVTAAPGVVVSAAGELDLQATGALLRRTHVLVAGDTGPMHLATAVERPVVALFGPTVEAFGFFPYQARSTVLQLPLTCRPCSSKGGARCPLVHHQCLEGLLPDQVLAATLEYCR